MLIGCLIRPPIHFQVLVLKSYLNRRETAQSICAVDPNQMHKPSVVLVPIKQAISNPNKNTFSLKVPGCVILHCLI